MRLGDLCGEAIRNLLSGTSRAVLLGFSLTVLLVGIIVSDIATITGIEERSTAYRAQGGAVRVLTVPGGVDATTCDNLASLDGVTVAGTVHSVESVRVTALGLEEILVIQVSVGMLGVLGVRDSMGSGVYLSDALAERWSMHVGDRLHTDRGSVDVLATFPQSEGPVTDPRFSSAIVEVAPASAPGSECWVEFWPPTPRQDALLLVAAVHVGGVPQVGQANPAAGEAFAPAAEFAGRATRHIAPIAILSGALLGAISMRVRRIELMANLHLGASRSALASIAALEVLVWGMISAGASAMSVQWICRSLFPDAPGALTWSYVPLIFASAAAAVLGAVAVILSTDSKGLLRAFKAR